MTPNVKYQPEGLHLQPCNHDPSYLEARYRFGIRETNRNTGVFRLFRWKVHNEFLNFYPTPSLSCTFAQYAENGRCVKPTEHGSWTWRTWGQPFVALNTALFTVDLPVASCSALYCDIAPQQLIRPNWFICCKIILAEVKSPTYNQTKTGSIIESFCILNIAFPYRKRHCCIGRR